MKTPVLESLFNKVAGLRLETLLKRSPRAAILYFLCSNRNLGSKESVWVIYQDGITESGEV